MVLVDHLVEVVVGDLQTMVGHLEHLVKEVEEVEQKSLEVGEVGVEKKSLEAVVVGEELMILEEGVLEVGWEHLGEVVGEEEQEYYSETEKYNYFEILAGEEGEGEGEEEEQHH